MKKGKIFFVLLMLVFLGFSSAEAGEVVIIGFGPVKTETIKTDPPEIITTETLKTIKLSGKNRTFSTQTVEWTVPINQTQRQQRAVPYPYTQLQLEDCIVAHGVPSATLLTGGIPGKRRNWVTQANPCGCPPDQTCGCAAEAK